MNARQRTTSAYWRWWEVNYGAARAPVVRRVRGMAARFCWFMAGRKYGRGSGEGHRWLKAHEALTEPPWTAANDPDYVRQADGAYVHRDDLSCD